VYVDLLIKRFDSMIWVYWDCLCIKIDCLVCPSKIWVIEYVMGKILGLFLFPCVHDRVG
jgi:hypothetical protein